MQTQIEQESAKRRRSRDSREAELHRRQRERLTEQMQYSEEMQRDHNRMRYSMGLPVQFNAVSQYGKGLTPLLLPDAANLQSWHVSTLGMTQAQTLLPPGASPSISWSTDLQQAIPFQCTTSAGVRGVATYALSIDGGATTFQSGLTATTISVPLLGNTLTFASGTYIAGAYLGLVKQLTNQAINNPAATLLGRATDSSKPVLTPNAQNGFQGIFNTSGNAMYDATSGWAASVASDPTGAGVNFQWFIVGSIDSAAPSAVRALMCMAQKASATPVYFLGALNGTNVYRMQRTNDAGTNALQSAGALTTAFKLYTVQVSKSALQNVTLWVNKTKVINNLAFGTGPITLDNVGLFGETRGTSDGGASNANRATVLELTTYNTVSSAADTDSIQNYFIGKYNLP